MFAVLNQTQKFYWVVKSVVTEWAWNWAQEEDSDQNRNFRNWASLIASYRLWLIDHDLFIIRKTIAIHDIAGNHILQHTFQRRVKEPLRLWHTLMHKCMLGRNNFKKPLLQTLSGLSWDCCSQVKKFNTQRHQRRLICISRVMGSFPFCSFGSFPRNLWYDMIDTDVNDFSHSTELQTLFILNLLFLVWWKG